MSKRSSTFSFAPHIAPQGTPLLEAFYLGPNPEPIAQALLGKVLCTAGPGGLTSGIIVETEAYKSQGDKACHSNNGRRTPRTEVMFWRGGIAYVYICYGIHRLFNIVTAPEDQADAILIRAAEPLDGIDIIRNRRPKADPFTLLKGPGALCEGLGITSAHNSTKLIGPEIWIEDRGITPSHFELKTGPRIGVESAGEAALFPWRYWVAGSRYVSAKRT